MRRTPGLLCIFLFLVWVTPAQATHFFFEDVQVNGVPLDSTSGRTFPVIQTPGAFTLTFDTTGEPSSDVTFDVIFSQDIFNGGNLPTPVNEIGLTHSTGTVSHSISRSFPPTASNGDFWFGAIVLAERDSIDANYMNLAGGSTTNPPFPITFEIVPEPSTFLLLGTGAGFLLVFRGARRRRQRDAQPQTDS